MNSAANGGQHYRSVQVLLHLLLLLISSHPSFCQSDNSALTSFIKCMNGGRWDATHYTCRCTPFYHGRYCQNSFSSHNPCSNISSIPVIADDNAVHRLGNKVNCRINNTCIPFHRIPESWYRMKSDAGSYLIDSCPTNENACGSRQAVVLTNVMREDNNNVPLFSADAVVFDRSKVGQSPCHDEYDVRYPVRILQCSADQKLYYLRNLPGMRMHYCIGDKEKCENGSRSVANNGFAPCVESDECVPAAIVNAKRPELTQIYIEGMRRTSSLQSKFRCTAFASHSHSSGVTYTMQWNLTLSNGSSMIIGGSGCRKEGIQISEDGSASMECQFEDLIARNLFAYGGTLTCQLLAKCNKDLKSYYRTVPVVSNSHSLSFDFYHKSDNSVVKPGDKVELCVNVSRFPPKSSTTFYFSVARQRIISRDSFKDNSNDYSDDMTTSPCEMKLTANTTDTVICRQMSYRNFSLEDQQISFMKVNVSFMSTSEGMHTKGRKHPIDGVEFMMDQTMENPGQSSPLIVYKNAVQPVNGHQNGEIHLTQPSGTTGYRVAMRHKMMPYEIQMKVQSDDSGSTYITGVAIRFEYYVIRIYGNKNLMLNVRVESSLPALVYRHLIPQQINVLPDGVKIDKHGFMVKLRFEQFGTVIDVRGLGLTNYGCSQSLMHCNDEPKFVGNLRALEVLVEPGYYDTQSLVTGLMYGNDIEPTQDRILFNLLTLKLPSENELMREEVEVPMKICKCNEWHPNPPGCSLYFNRL